MSEKLLPCPFCGGEPEFWDGKGTQADLTCSDCGQASIGVQVIDLMTYEERYDPENSFCMKTLSYPLWVVNKVNKEMSERWNTRYDDKYLTLEAENKRLREALENVVEHCLGKPDHKDKWAREYAGELAEEALKKSGAENKGEAQ